MNVEVIWQVHCRLGDLDELTLVEASVRGVLAPLREFHSFPLVSHGTTAAVLGICCVLELGHEVKALLVFSFEVSLDLIS